MRLFNGPVTIRLVEQVPVILVHVDDDGGVVATLLRVPRPDLNFVHLSLRPPVGAFDLAYGGGIGRTERTSFIGNFGGQIPRHATTVTSPEGEVHLILSNRPHLAEGMVGTVRVHQLDDHLIAYALRDTSVRLIPRVMPTGAM